MTPETPITILLAEDHAIVRQGLRALLNVEPDFRVIGEAQTGREAVKLAETLRPAVIVMDIAMPILNGLEATRQILVSNPTAKVLMLSAHSDDEYIRRTSLAGAVGFLKKQASGDVLAKAIREVAKGNPYFGPGHARRQLDFPGKARGRDGLPKQNAARLTARESEVLQLVAEGSANKQVAAELGISIKTVEKHRQHLMDKLNIHDIAGLTRFAISSGVIESSLQKSIG